MDCIEYRRARKRSTKIDEVLRLDSKRKKQAVDVLVLGTEVAGKETFLKQIRELIKGLDKPECRTKGNREAVTCKETMYIHETCFIYNDRDYRMIDLSSNVSVSKTKWIHFLEDVNVIIFVLDLSQYDTPQEGGFNKGHILESLVLFEEICNSAWFKEKSVILYLDNLDSFENKLRHTPFSSSFPDYTGSDTSDDAKTYILERLKDLDRNHESRKTDKQIICNCNLLSILNDIREICPVAEDFEGTGYKEPGICEMSASDICFLCMFYCLYYCCMQCCCPSPRHRSR